MVSEFFNYSTSVLNPVLKWVAIILMIVALVFLILSNRGYRWKFRGRVILLIWSVVVGFLSFFFRRMGDVFDLGFKWGESLFALAFVLSNFLVAYYFLKYTEEADKNFES